jgi:long-chain acyl-CoA synthetase
MNDGPLWLAGFLGVLRAGGVAVPFDSTTPPDLLRAAARELELAAWCGDPELPDLNVALALPQVEIRWAEGRASSQKTKDQVQVHVPWPDPDPNRLAEIVLTSGTSGVPKAVPISHRNLRAVLDPLAAEIRSFQWAQRWAPPLRLAVSLPLAHLYGQVMGVFLPAHLHAHTIMIPTLAAPEIARALREEGCTVLATVPRTLGLLARFLRTAGEERWGEQGFQARLDSAAASPWPHRWFLFAPLRRLLGYRMVAVVSGGAALDRELEQFWRLLGYGVVQGYGLTEAAPLVALNHPFHPVAGSLGKPLAGVQVRIAEDGEILVRGASVATARLALSTAARVDDRGWLHTGDLGRQDPDGRLFYLGRKGERVVTPAGVNVDPEPLVAALRREPGIVDAAVLERPWGSPGILCAVLVSHPGADIARAVHRVNLQFPDAARIRSWESWPGADFPRTPTGKPRRADLVAWLAGQAPVSSSAATESPASEAAVLPEPRGPSTLTDSFAAFAALARMVGDLVGTDPSRLSPGTSLADALSSLDRVELATLIESVYGVTPSDEAIAGQRTLGELALELLRQPGIPTSHAASGMAPHRFARSEDETRTAAEPALESDRGGEEPEAAPEVEAESRLRPPSAPWRTWLPVRAARWVLREAVVRPGFAVFVRLEAAKVYQATGIEPPFLIAANHVSLLDPVAVIMTLPLHLRGRIAPAARWSFFAERASGLLQYRAAVVGFNVIPLVQAGDWRPTLRIAGALADHGYCPLIFPEGERSGTGDPGEFHLGVALMAQSLHLPILPCAAAGLHAVFPRGTRWPRRPGLRRPVVAVAFGPPLPAPRPDDELAGAVRTLRARILELHREALASAGRR